ncbi:hypothetical protein C7212DRAFT_341078 [Tuber magnatum]|uniref:Uncharacterized protein n=1 Tax=Tuber magnatum TaxID=42249 RepID=A0A317T3D8_9PEZI|nr:hypothetical protein C7212DRAFT_341078 [Tuber magnatum]
MDVPLLIEGLWVVLATFGFCFTNLCTTPPQPPSPPLPHQLNYLDLTFTRHITSTNMMRPATTSAKKQTRQRRLWFRNRSPVHARSGADGLPGISRNPRTQTTPQKVEDAIPTKPREPRTTPSTTLAVRKSSSSRKCKSALTGRARKRSRSSLTPGDKQVEGNISDDGQAAEVDRKDDEPDYEDKVKIPGVSDDGASSPGGYYHEQDTDAYTKPNKYTPRDRAKPPSVILGQSAWAVANPSAWLIMGLELPQV